MGSFQDPMFWIVQHSLLRLGRPPPQNEHNGAVLFVQDPDRRIRELLPSNIPMGISLMGSHSKNGIQQHNALIRPLF